MISCIYRWTEKSSRAGLNLVPSTWHCACYLEGISMGLIYLVWTCSRVTARALGWPGPHLYCLCFQHTRGNFFTVFIFEFFFFLTILTIWRQDYTYHECSIFRFLDRIKRNAREKNLWINTFPSFRITQSLNFNAIKNDEDVNSSKHLLGLSPILNAFTNALLSSQYLYRYSYYSVFTEA